MKLSEKSALLLKDLKSCYPDAHCELNHNSPFQLLIATILSAQCTDVRVNMVTPHLFKKYPDPLSLSKAKLSDVEDIIRSTGFYRNKAKNIISCAQELIIRHQGIIPKSLEELSSLSGVGRKTANVVLGNAFGINDGVVVDTHVKRISKLLKITRFADPIKIEKDLMKIFPKTEWTLLSHLFIFHGRRICIARRPKCHECQISYLCPSKIDKT